MPDYTHYRLLTETTYGTGNVSKFAYDPYETIAGCKRTLAKKVKDAKHWNTVARRNGNPPHILSITAKIEGCTWEPVMDLPEPNVAA